MPYWTLLPEESSSKTLEYRPGARTGTEGEEYGDVDVYDQTAPVEQVILSGDGFTTAEKNAVKAVHKAPADTAGGIYVATDCEGITYTGPISSFSARRERGHLFWQVQITMPNPVVAGP